MKLHLTDTQQRLIDETKRLYLSEAAIAARSDDTVRKMANIGLLDQLLGAYKELKQRRSDTVESDVYNSKGQIVRGKKELPGYELVIPQETVYESPQEARAAEQRDLYIKGELLQQEIDETKFIKRYGEEQRGISAFTDSEMGIIRDAIQENISRESIMKMGALGTKDRTYPKDYKDVNLAGTVIPINWKENEQYERGIKLIMQRAGQVHSTTGFGLHGRDVDAMHGVAAANDPSRITDISNIDIGPSSYNQSVKRAEGDALTNAQNTRLQSKREEQFEYENGTRAAPVDKGSVTKSENLAQSKYEKARDKQVNELLLFLQQENLGTVNKGARQLTSKESIMNTPLRMAGTSPEAARALELASGKRTDSPGDSKERALYINSGGGNVSIGHDVLRSNGNGKHKNGNGH